MFNHPFSGGFTVGHRTAAVKKQEFQQPWVNAGPHSCRHNLQTVLVFLKNTEELFQPSICQGGAVADVDVLDAGLFAKQEAVVIFVTLDEKLNQLVCSAALQVESQLYVSTLQRFRSQVDFKQTSEEI